MFDDFALVISTIGLIFCSGQLIRNNRVYSYRSELLSIVSKRCQEDIAAGRPWLWRYDAFQAVSYQDMFWKFWRRLDSFYPDRKFVRNGEDE